MLHIVINYIMLFLKYTYIVIVVGLFSILPKLFILFLVEVNKSVICDIIASLNNLHFAIAISSFFYNLVPNSESNI